jgi:hypothetical protein
MLIYQRKVPHRVSLACAAGYDSVSVLSKHGGLAPLRIGFWRQAAPGKPPAYMPDALLSAVEPLAAQLLELPRLYEFGEGLTYAPSRNRQCHMYAVTERKDARSLALKRVFVRCGLLDCHCQPLCRLGLYATHMLLMHNRCRTGLTEDHWFC